MIKEKDFVKEAQEIIYDTFGKSFFNENLFNDLMCGNKQLNYYFLSTYLDCLKETMFSKLPQMSYREVIDNFLPAYKQSMKHLPSSYILFSLMNFNRAYAQTFNEFRTEENYKEVTSALLGNEKELPFDYKWAISLHFPQYYKFKKNKPTL